MKLQTSLFQSSLVNYLNFFFFNNFFKGNPARVDAAPMMDVSGVISGNMDHSACVMPPPTKRSKLYAFFVPVMLQFFEY